MNKVEPDILQKAGAGQEGTDELADTYKKDTPVQKEIMRFKEFIKIDRED